MLWIILSLLGVGGAAAYLKSQAEGTRGTPSKVGEDAAPTEPHGRLAKCGKPGGGFGGAMRSIIHASHKALFTAAAATFTGGVGAKQLTALSDKIMKGPSGGKKKIPDGQTMNVLSNLEVAIVGVDVAREQLTSKKNAWKKLYASADVTPASFQGSAEEALAAVFRIFFLLGGDKVGVLFPGCAAQHIAQGVAILMYGPGAAEIVVQYRSKRPKTADGKPIPTMTWIKRTVQALEDLKARREGAVDPAFGAEENVPSDAALRAELAEAQDA